MSTKESPMKLPFLAAIGGALGFTGTAAVTAGAIGVGTGVAGIAAARGISKGNRKRRNQIRKANQELKEQKRAYLDFDVTNPYMGLTNAYADMENVMEDLTVDQKAAQFQAEQGAQQRADILANLRGTAGTSGVAALAQTLASQSQLASQRISASIGQQEAANQRAAAQQAGELQTMERQGDWKADMTRRAGAEQSRQLEKQKARYRKFDFKNPYAGMRNQFEGMENKMEDLTVNQKEAEFASQQFAQSQSNIMSGLRGAAGLIVIFWFSTSVSSDVMQSYKYKLACSWNSSS